MPERDHGVSLPKTRHSRSASLISPFAKKGLSGTLGDKRGTVSGTTSARLSMGSFEELLEVLTSGLHWCSTASLHYSNADRKKMSSRAKYLVLTSDMGRPYTDILRCKGTWVMENWLHWAETFCPVIAHDVLKESCPQAFDAWMHLRRAFLHYLCSHECYPI